MTGAQAAALLARERQRELQQAEAEARERRLAERPDVLLDGATPPGWLARKMGRLYAEPLQDVRDGLLLSIDRVEFSGLSRGRRRWAIIRFMAAREAARARLSDLSQYGAQNILQFAQK